MIWPTLLPVAQCVLGTPWFQVSSRKCLVLRGIYPLPLALPLDQNENWDSRPEVGQKAAAAFKAIAGQ